MKKTIILFTTLFIMGCGATVQQVGLATLNTLKEAATNSESIVFDRWDSKCEAAATTCIDKNNCPELDLCQEKRRKVAEMYIKFYKALKLAYVALPFADKDALQATWDSLLLQLKTIMESV